MVQVLYKYLAAYLTLMTTGGGVRIRGDASEVHMLSHRSPSPP